MHTYPAETIAGCALAIALLGAAWLLDPFAEGGFDAPKRLVALAAAVFASAALAWDARWPMWRHWSRPAQWIAALGVVISAGLILSAAMSPRPDQAWSALRTLALFALFLPLGASVLLSGPWGKRLLKIALLAAAVNALLSLMQAAGLKLPLSIAKLGGRLPTGALLGNEGYVALACALMASACLAIALNTGAQRTRRLALGCGALGVLAILLNLQLTSAIALAAAALSIAAVRWQKQWLISAGAALLLIAVTTALVPPLRAATWAALPAGGVEGYQRITTYRLGAWVAALDMAAARPLTGYGPGTFAAEVQTQRFAAEIAMHERLRPPINANGFVFAHQDYLQLAAEAGVPVLLAILAALGMLLTGLLRLARAPGAPEPLLLLGVLIAGAIAALAWFPMQIPFTAIVLLLTCGRAWRLIAESGRGAA